MNISHYTQRKNKKNLLQYASIFILLMTVVLFSASVKATAGDVVLNPGYISGTVSIDGVTLNSADISAYSGSESASTSTSNGSYTLTVNTPTDGTSITYNVNATARSDSYKDYLYFKSQSVAATEGNTSTLDFNVNPGYVDGTITVTGATLSYARVYANLNSSGNYTNARTIVGSDGAFSFPVQPNSNIRIYGYAYMTNGASYNLENKYIDVSASGTTTQDYTLTINAGTPGSIEGSIGVNGVTDIDRNYVYGYGPSGSSKSTNTTGNTFSLTGLLPGNWNLNAYAYMNNFDDYFSHPNANITRPINVPPGGTVTQDIVSDASFVNGTISLSGSKGIQDLNSARIEASGIYNTPSYGGYSRDNINLNNGDYDLVVTEGDWDIYYSYYNFYNSDPNDYLNSQVYMYDYSRLSSYGGVPVSTTAGQTINNHDFSYQTGTVTINFSVLGGGTLSNPYVYGYGQLRDENNILQQSTSVRSYGPYGSTTQGSVTIVGMPMIHDFTAYATVNGSRTTFGRLTIEVLPGTDIVVDIGGPTLTVTSPTAEHCTSDSSVTVSGTVTDDTEVEDVTVNGNSVTLTSTENPDDDAEVSFSTTVVLSSGPNSIEIVATDGSGKTASLTSTVYKDIGPPVIVWTPADGTTTPDTSITIEGTATDDNPIGEINVNGNSVSFSSSNNPLDPNEVSFSTTVSLNDGQNTIVVEVPDNCDTTSETRTVTKASNSSPVAVCRNVKVSADAGCTADADINNGSYDPDGDPITTTQSPVGPYGLGITTVTLTVTDDSGASDSCTAIVTVEDTTPPVITCTAPITVGNDPGICGAVVNYTAPTGTDNCSGALTTQTGGLGSGSTFPIGTTTETYKVTDAAGNTASCSFTVTVNDVTAPVISCPADVTVECDSVPAIVTPTATDNCDTSPSVSYDGEVRTDGDCPNRYTLTRTWTATDSAGNTDTCVQTITVEDTKAPVINSAYANPHVLWPANHKMVEITPIIEATDNCSGSGNFAVTIQTISSNESDNGYGVGDGNTTNDVQVDNEGRIFLRAERGGRGDGRVYTITMSVTDDCGNVSLPSFTVEVPHDQSAHSCDDPDCDLNN